MLKAIIGLLYPMLRKNFWNKLFYEPDMQSLQSKYTMTNFQFPEWIYKHEENPFPIKERVLLNVKQIRIKINLERNVSIKPKFIEAEDSIESTRNIYINNISIEGSYQYYYEVKCRSRRDIEGSWEYIIC